MNKVQNRISIVLLTILTFPICAYLFSLIWDFFKMSSIKNDNLFVYTSEFDPNEKEPTIIIFIILFIISVLLSKFTIFLLNYKLKKSTNF